MILSKTIKISGKIDSNNAKQFEDTLLPQAESDNICLDAAELEYISSAGLRVLLKLKKAVGDEVSVINVSKDVYDIFEVTGFTSLLNVKKALKTIDLKNAEIIGKGATGIVYRLDRETIVKVFNENVQPHIIENEGIKAKNALIFGVPTAISFDTVRVGKCYGVVYELLDADDLLNIIRKDKAHLKEYVANYARKMKEMHSIEVDDRFDDTKSGTLSFLNHLTGTVCTEEETEKIKGVIKNIPDANTFIHGDAHMGNVMYKDGEYMFIDLSTAGKGHPIFDMVSMYSGFKMSLGMSEERRQARELTRGFTLEEIETIWNTYLSAYLDTEDEKLLNKAEEQILAVTCSRTILAAIAIPGLIPPETLAYFKNTAVSFFDKGLEPICF